MDNALALQAPERAQRVERCRSGHYRLEVVLDYRAIKARWDAMAATESIPNALDRLLAAERVRARYPHRAPAGWYEFARGAHGPVAEHVRLRIDLYGYLEEGAAFEIRRRGRLEGAASVSLVACRNGEVTLSDPRLLALHRRQRPLAASA